MTRVIAGRAGGRRLRTPQGRETRPTTDRVREALFAAVSTWSGAASAAEGLRGLRVLDLYAGSGALGLEAWSRGAAAVTLVEADRRTAAVVLANARELGADGQARVVTAAVATFLARGVDGAPYDVVLSDPPYPLGEDALATDLRLLVEQGWLASSALVVVERSSRSPEPRWPGGLVDVERRPYGETALWFAHTPAGDTGPSPEEP